MTSVIDLKPPDIEHIQSPYPYQVSGHGALLKLPNGKISKPLIQRELDFYQSIARTYPTLLPFLAPFYGTMKIEITRDKIEDWMKYIQEQEDEHKTLTSGILKENTAWTVLSVSPTPSPSTSPSNPLTIDTQPEPSHANTFQTNEVIINPWSLRVSKRSLTQLLKNFDETSTSIIFKYLVLGDLTTRYKHPCICDIKIGTRQYGDDAAPDKKRRHIKKAESTTSSQCGLRLCGQLVYQSENRMYRHFDKYEGRKLSVQTIKPAVAQFFFDGTRFKRNVIMMFVEKLKKLIEVMESEDNIYRFYSTSLLLLYEGDPEQEITGVDLKMIDFAHTFSLEDEQENDDGYLFGLRNLAAALEDMYTNHQYYTSQCAQNRL